MQHIHVLFFTLRNPTPNPGTGLKSVLCQFPQQTLAFENPVYSLSSGDELDGAAEADDAGASPGSLRAACRRHRRSLWVTVGIVLLVVVVVAVAVGVSGEHRQFSFSKI